jgi:hypothetical protein
MMDVDRIEHPVVEKTNDQEQWKAWDWASGARMSAMEHLVPEMMFSTEENPAHGISAVKALQLAAAEGQKIWAITQTNLNISLAAINLPSDIETDIRNSVNAGKEVTAHEAAVDFYGSSQVIDPEIGAGGYLIGGGENGGWIGGIIAILLGIYAVVAASVFMVALFSGFIPALTAILLVYGLWFMVYGLWFMVYGLWFMVYGLWFMVYGLWFMGNGK